MLEQPIRVGKLELKNRLAMAPMAVYKAEADGSVSPALCEHYEQRAAAGKLGLIIVEHSFIAPEGQAKPNQLSVSRDADVAGLAKLAQACKCGGTAAFCQISHAGAAARRTVTGLQPVAPSPLVSPAAIAGDDTDLPHSLSPAEIATVVAAFASAARRVRDAGFDGVEVHSAHAYLLDEFYSPLMNRRADEYGGTLDKRLHIHREVLAAVRDAVGADFTVGVRLGGCDYEEGGATIADAVEAGRQLEAAGADYLSLSGGWHAWRRPGHDEPGWFADQAAAVKAAVSIPVLTAGGVKSRVDAESLLAAGVCDIVGAARPLLKNPSWPD